MKYIFEPVNKKQLNLFIRDNLVSDILLNIEGYSLGLAFDISADEINKILKKTDKISLKIDRIFHEDEISELEKFLKSINLLKIKYLFYSDLAVYDILKEMNMQDKLVYDAFTYLTNSLDVSLYSEYNKYVVVSNQISVSEINNILAQINTPVMIHGFGKSIIFYSKRKLLTNYFKYRNVLYNPTSKNYYLQEELRAEKYHIVEDKNGAYIYEKGYYYLMNDVTNLDKVGYMIIHCGDLDAFTYQQVVNCYLNNDEASLLKLNIDLSKGIMENKSVLLKSEVTD